MTAVVTQTYTPPPPASISDGTYVLGTDIVPGRYHTTGGGDNIAGCYYARLGSLDTSNIIANDLSQGPMTVDVQASDTAVEFKGGCQWTKIG